MTSRSSFQQGDDHLRPEKTASPPLTATDESADRSEGVCDHWCLSGRANTACEVRGDLQRTSRCSGCWSWPMELLAVHRYWPAYVNWTFFKVSEDTRAWLRTTIFLSRLCSKERKGPGQVITFSIRLLLLTGSDPVGRRKEAA